MVSLTLSVPEELRKKMSEHSEIKWSEVVRAILEQQIRDIEEANRITSKSKLTETDVDEIAELMEKGMTKRWREEISKRK